MKRPWEYQEGTLPWTKTCFVCGQDNPHGLKLRSRVEGDTVVLNHVPRAADLGYRHLVHGGISMTLLDEVMTWAAILTFKGASVAAELTVRLKQPVVAWKPIRIEGWITLDKARLVATEGRIVDANQIVLATATGKYVSMPGEGRHLCVEDFVDSDEAIYLPFLKG
ncbi:MAG: PaaI family thioesterase [bacterium]